MQMQSRLYSCMTFQQLNSYEGKSTSMHMTASFQQVQNDKRDLDSFIVIPFSSHSFVNCSISKTNL